MQYLSGSQTEYSPVVIDRYALGGAILPLIFKVNRPGVIQIVFRVDGDVADVYVVDERGSLFSQRIAFYDRGALVEHLKIFCEAVINRQQNDISINGSDMPSAEIEFYEAVKDERGGRKLASVSVEKDKRRAHYFNVQVISDANEEDPSRFTIYCDDVEFPGLQLGDKLFDAVAAYMMKQRGSGARYPVYITDIDLPRAVFGVEVGGRIQTIHFLNYKKQIEEQLRQALNRVGTMPQGRAD
jgi:adenylate cyclase class 1